MSKGLVDSGPELGPPNASDFDGPTAVGSKGLDLSQGNPQEGAPSSRGSVPPIHSSVGLSFADLLAAKPALEVKLRALVELLHALCAVHTNLVRPPAERCHGSLNPQLVLISAEGTASLIWRTVHEAEADVKAYIAPEVRAGRAPDQQADIYAVGVMLYEALTGNCPQDFAQAQSERRGLAALADGSESESLLSNLLSIALTALETDPGRRWQSALSFAHAMTQAAGSRLAARHGLGQAVSKAISGRSLLAMVRNAPKDSKASNAGPGDSLAAQAVSQGPGPLPSSAWQPAHSRSKRRAAQLLLAVTLLCTCAALGYWLGKPKTVATQVDPSPGGTNQEASPAAATQTSRSAQSTNAPGSSSSEQNKKGHSLPIQLDEEPSLAATELEKSNRVNVEHKASSDKQQTRRPARSKAPSRQTPYEPEGI